MVIIWAMVKDNFGLILFMGERTEHALTSIQRYLPRVVYIVTSEKFATKHKRRLRDWSKHYTFKSGGVKVIENLFDKSAITSILNQVISIKSEEEELHDSQLIWRLGITGGTSTWLLGSYYDLFWAWRHSMYLCLKAKQSQCQTEM